MAGGIGSEEDTADQKKAIKLFKEVVNEETFSEDLRCVRLPTLNLRACRLKYDIWNDLPSREVEIDELKLDYTDLRKNIQGLPKCLANAHVEKLSLIDTKLKNENFKTFLAELKEEDSENIKLHSVNLMHVEIDTDGFETLAKILNLLPSDVQALNITHCGLTDEAIETFCRTLSKDKVVHELTLGHTDRLTPDGMKSIGKLAVKSRVRKLGLAMCYLSDEHLKEARESFPDSIESLDLRENTTLSASAVTSLALKWNTLKELDVRGAWFDRGELRILEKNLTDCKIISDKLVDEAHMYAYPPATHQTTDAGKKRVRQTLKDRGIFHVDSKGRRYSGKTERQSTSLPPFKLANQDSLGTNSPVCGAQA